MNLLGPYVVDLCRRFSIYNFKMINDSQPQKSLTGLIELKNVNKFSRD